MVKGHSFLRLSLGAGVFELYVNTLQSQRAGISLSLALVTSPGSTAKTPPGPMHVYVLTQTMLHMVHHMGNSLLMQGLWKANRGSLTPKQVTGDTQRRMSKTAS